MTVRGQPIRLPSSKKDSRPRGRTGVVRKLNGVDYIDVPAQELQRKGSGLVACERDQRRKEAQSAPVSWTATMPLARK